MNLSAERTLWLQSATHMNVSLTLQHVRGVASPGLRRGVALTSVCVPAGGHVDLCRVLGVSLEEAKKILEGSPEYQLHRAKQRVYALEYPPLTAPVGPPVVVQAPPAPQDRTPRLVPVPSVTPEPVVAQVDGDGDGDEDEDEDGAPVPTLPTELDGVSEPLGEMPLPPAPIGAVADMAGPSDDAEVEIPLTEPSMDWTEEQLRAYAIARGIDVAKTRSKTGILRAIRRPAGAGVGAA